MDNFRYHAFTEIYFGKNQIENLPAIIKRYGTKVLLVYGSGSIKRNGLYDEINRLLKDCQIVECSGVEPNPRIDTVRKGAKLCKENNIDVVLAVGGGSAIDCAKMIAVSACSDTDAWILIKDKSLMTKALPVVTILTNAATGSEMNRNAVITNLETKEKIGGGVDIMIPKVSILDPTYTFTLPPIQTAAGAADIMSHVMENYFKLTPEALIQDHIMEGILKTCLECTPVVLKKPDDYNARANLMWASSLALNGICGSGKNGSWSCHPIEHQLSAQYDIAHGVGLAIITPSWMRHVLNDKTVTVFDNFATNVFGINGISDKFELANKGIDKLEETFVSWGLPNKLSQINIDDSRFELMADMACAQSSFETSFIPLTKQDIITIYKMSE